MVIFTARQNLANLNEVKINLIVKFANLAGKSYTLNLAVEVENTLKIIVNIVWQPPQKPDPLNF